MRSTTSLQTFLVECKYFLLALLLVQPNSIVVCRKHIQFQPFTPKDIVRISEVQVSIAELYQNNEDGTRTTALQGPLDARMVCLSHIYIYAYKALTTLHVHTGTQREGKEVCDLWRRHSEMCWALWLHQACFACIPYRIL